MVFREFARRKVTDQKPPPLEEPSGFALQQEELSVTEVRELAEPDPVVAMYGHPPDIGMCSSTSCQVLY